MVAEHVPDDADRRWIEPAMLSLLGVPGVVVETEQLFGAWRTFFERLAADVPVALVFEDLHWADSGMLDFIDYLLEWSRNQPIFILTLARPDLLERRPNWGAGKRQFTSALPRTPTRAGDPRSAVRTGARPPGCSDRARSPPVRTASRSMQSRPSGCLSRTAGWSRKAGRTGRVATSATSPCPSP